MTAEMWKDIEGYVGYFQISNTGKVKSLNYRHTKKPHLLKQVDNGSGYKQVHLSKNCSLKWYTVHRLVAKAFLDNPHNKSTVNHIDGNRSNNNVKNLEWATYSENNLHSYRHNKRKHPRSRKIRCVETNIIYESAYDASRRTGACATSINKCISGIQKKAKGMHWGLLDKRKEKIYVN